MRVRCITIVSVMGQLARWVVEQSPHYSARGVDQVNMRLFKEASQSWPGIVDDYHFRWKNFRSWHDLEDWLREALGKEPWLGRWNSAFKGRHSPGGDREDMVRIDSGSIAHYDYDFIDIDALLRNVARSAWQEAKAYEQEEKGW